MDNIDILKIRKMAGMSQRELAEKLQVRQSFLSAIENGRSRLPEEKLLRIQEIFGIDDLAPYIKEYTQAEVQVVPPHTHAYEEKDSLTSLLEHIHDLAHQKDRSARPDKVTAERLEFLTRRNDRLSERVDELREQVDALREENFRLKELLCRHSIDF